MRVTILLFALCISSQVMGMQVLTQRYDAGRSGANTAETILTTTNVKAGLFGKVFELAADGEVYAQPLYVPGLTVSGKSHNVVIICTMHNFIYAYDADTGGAALWSRQLVPFADNGTSDTDNDVGITATPVIDPSTHTMFLVTESKESGSYFNKVWAIDITTGNNNAGINGGNPRTVAATSGNATLTGDKHFARPGLLLLGGKIYAGFGSHSDIGPYWGWVLSYNTSDLSLANVFCVTPANGGGGAGAVWQSNNGLMSDGTFIYCMTGNGDNNAKAGGTSYSESFLKLDANLNLVDWYMPSNTDSLNAGDEDLGSGGPMLIPGTSLLVGTGKDHFCYLLNTANLGHFDASDTRYVQRLDLGGGGPVGTADNNPGPTYWAGPGGPYIYYSLSNNIPMQLKFANNAVSVFKTATHKQGEFCGAMSLSANGTTAGTGVVWASLDDNVLHAYNAEDISVELWNSGLTPGDALGAYTKMSCPTVAAGRVYATTSANKVVVYGLISPVFTSVKVTPASAFVPMAGTQSFSAAALDQFGANMVPQPTFTWSVSGGGTISTSGLFTAGGTPGGPFTVTAQATINSNTKSGTASVSVISTTPTITLTPTSLAPACVVGTNATSQTFTVKNTGGGTLSWSGSVNQPWLSLSPAPVALSTGQSQTITVTYATSGLAVAAYPATITVTAAGATNSPQTIAVTLTVSNATLTIGENTVLPLDDNGNANLLFAQNATLSQAATIQSMSFYVTTTGGNLRLGVYDATGPGGGPGALKAATAEFTPATGWNTQPVIAQAALTPGSYWLAYLPQSNSLGLRKQTGFTPNSVYYSLAYGPLPGTFAAAGLSSSTSHWSLYATLITGASNQPPIISSGPWANPNPVNSTSTVVMTAATDPDNGPLPLSYTWSKVSGPGTVSFAPNGSGASSTSTATFTAAGAYTLQVAVSDGAATVTGSVIVTVNQTLTSIVVSPSSASVPLNGAQAFTGSAKDQFGATLTAQPALTWSVSGGGTISTAGVFTAGSTVGGPFTVTAGSGTTSGTASVTVIASSPITAPLVVSSNPNYFQDSTGTPIVLCGSHSWNTLQDWGTNGTPQTLDFNAFVSFLTAHGHNFTLLWRSELPKFSGLPTLATNPPDFTVSSHPWMRTGPGNATDGKLKFDLTKFDQSFFDRERARVQALNNAGIYAGVYLFTGEWMKAFRSSTDGYPFTGANNINGVDDGGGTNSITMTAPNTITAYQDAFIQKTIDTLNDLPNVLWIVSEEAPVGSDWWSAHVISTIRSYEATKPAKHPIGWAAPDSGDTTLYNSNADWVAPVARISPTQTSGTGTPTRKVNINDSDHSYFGMWNDTLQTNRNYIWENFTNGNQVIFMDPYAVYYPREGRNLPPNVVDGIGSGPDPRYDNFRDNMGYLIRYSKKLNLTKVTSQNSLSSTGNCLAQTPAAGAQYLVYAPSGGSFTVNLSAMPNTRSLSGEWFNPSSGAATSVAPFAAGSASQSFTPPFSGDAVLYLSDVGTVAPSISLTPASLSPANVVGTNATAQTFTVKNTGGGTLNWSGSVNQPWLSLSPAPVALAAGQSQTVTVTYATSSLTVGTHPATITVSAAGATNTPQTIGVTLTVSNATPTIALSPTTLAPSSVVGTNAAAQTFTVKNTGGGTLNWSGSVNQPWLSLSPAPVALAAGQSQTVTVTYATSSLTAGTYPATITVTAAGATNTPQTVGVTLTVSNATPTIALSPTTLAPSSVVGTNAAAQTFTVKNTGAGTLNWSGSVNQPWLSLSPAPVALAAGQSQTVTATYATSSLTAGTYPATITVTATGATNTPQTVGVTLTVANATGTIGENTVLPLDDNGNGNLLLAQNATLNQASTIQSMSFYVTTTGGRLRMGVYDATGPNGGPGALKASTAEFTPVAGWNTQPTIAQVAFAPGPYWLAYLPESNALGFRKQSGFSPSSVFVSFPYSPLPSTFAASGLSSTTSHWSLYATFITGATANIAIDSGGGAVGSFGADQNFSGGNTYSTSSAINTTGLTNPAPQAVYQSERYGNFTYTIPNLTTGAAYTVRLHFAEVWWNSAGQRLFNVSINGQQVLSNFDIFAAAGGKFIAIVKDFTATAANGQIAIAYSTLKDNAKSSGIEIIPVGGTTHAVAPAAAVTEPAVVTGDGAISSIDLGVVKVGRAFKIKLDAPEAGKKTKLKWSVVDRTKLPHGVSASAGIVGGKPKTPGTFTFQLKINGTLKSIGTPATGNATNTYTLTVVP